MHKYPIKYHTFNCQKTLPINDILIKTIEISDNIRNFWM